MESAIVFEEGQARAATAPAHPNMHVRGEPPSTSCLPPEASFFLHRQQTMLRRRSAPPKERES